VNVAVLDFVWHFSAGAVWFWALLLIGVVWLRRHLDLNRADKDPPLDPGLADAGGDDWPKLTVLVAGKDEEANIEACLTGLLDQDYPGLEVIVVNDRSTDCTPEIIDRLAAAHANLRAVHVTELAAGWAGKNHAMHSGLQHATGELLCFTDADCRFHDRRLLRAAVRFAQRDGVDFLSVLPQLEAHTAWEKIIQPPAGAIMVFWFPPQKVNNPASPVAYANGAFMLMSRSAYDRMGGHEAFRTALNEDMHFARAAKRTGLRLHVMRGDGLYSVRMYVGMRQIWNGWSRIFYGCFGTWPRLIVSAIFLSVFSVSPLVSLLVSPLLGDWAVGIALASFATFVAQQTVLWRFYGLSRTPRPMALTYPIGAAVCLAMTFNAMTRLAGRKTQWRGTAYAGGA
jgi:cellulose synthase/poly-beta-1,6-N-acetylglucosamine synthase-like glycosyltransferase